MRNLTTEKFLQFQQKTFLQVQMTVCNKRQFTK
jgi:hypothetical protein